MTPTEAALLLGKAAGFDARTVGKADAVLWAEVLDGVDLADGMEAVARHYRDSTEWLKPAHVRRHVETIVRERVKATIAAAAKAAPCVHGNPGGALQVSEFGTPLCPLCRAVLRLPPGAQYAFNDLAPEAIDGV